MSFNVGEPCWVVVKGDPTPGKDHLGATQIKAEIKAVNSDGTVDVYRPAHTETFRMVRKPPEGDAFNSWPQQSDYYETTGQQYPEIPLIKGMRYVPRQGETVVLPEKFSEVADEGNGHALVCEYDTQFKPAPGFEDMVDMSKLNDAELCRNIQLAFDSKPPVGFIWCGATLVAVNTMMHIPMYFPGKPLHHVFSDDTMDKYKNMQSRQAVPPHSYALATDCYRALFTPPKGRSKCENQVQIGAELVLI